MRSLLILVVLLLTHCVDKTCCSINVTHDNIDIETADLKENRADISTASLRNSSTKLKATTTTRSSPASASSDEAPAEATKSGKEIFQNALKKAIGGGVPGAVAGVVQVLCLMWLRTVINYQYRYGSTFIQALSHLYSSGGIPRLYSGLGFALVQAPLSRFVSTAANDGVHNLIQNLEWTKHWGPGREVVVAAVVVGFCRMLLMPIDTSKTVMQIEGEKGFVKLISQVKKGKIHLLYAGSFANAASSFISHWPWFYTYNKLSRSDAIQILVPWTTGRNAMVGFLSSIVSDTVANFMRVIKTTKQALSATNVGITYAETISVILAVDGLRGLFGRGLRTRIMGNALQSILFTVIWRGLAQRWQQTKQVEKENDNYSSSESVYLVNGNNETDSHDNSEIESR
mmetsp:Transcript_13318/g.21858  ORF Transcript_13318/g.21858 Transcript_13318/m.21858 type:complete len:400 (-) Transcript_13318:3414-4613(-)